MKTLSLIVLAVLAVSCSKGSMSLSGLSASGGSSEGRVLTASEVFGDNDMEAIVAELETLADEQELTLCQAIATYSNGNSSLQAEIENELQVDCSV